MYKSEDWPYIDRVLNGNPTAFAYFVDKYGDQAYLVAIRLVKNREDAQEIVQDAFVKAYQHLSQFNRASRFSTWLYRIVYNTALNKLTVKSTSSSHHIETTDDAIAHQDLANHYIAQNQEEQLESIRQALEELPSEEALLLTLYYYENQTIAEISQIMTLSQSNVKVKLYRARKKMSKIVRHLLDTP